MYDDPQWTSQLYKSPKITFSTIYRLLVDRKVSLRKISHLEGVVERSQDGTCEEELSCDQEVPIEYTRTLEKAFVFFKDSHVQDIKYHPFPQKPGYVCIRSNVLPSVEKDHCYYPERIHRTCCKCTLCLSSRVI